MKKFPPALRSFSVAWVSTITIIALTAVAIKTAPFVGAQTTNNPFRLQCSITSCALLFNAGDAGTVPYLAPGAAQSVNQNDPILVSFNVVSNLGTVDMGHDLLTQAGSGSISTIYGETGTDNTLLVFPGITANTTQPTLGANQNTVFFFQNGAGSNELFTFNPDTLTTLNLTNIQVTYGTGQNSVTSTASTQNITISTPPPPPTNILTTEGDTQVTLTWDAPAILTNQAPVTSYFVRYSTSNTFAASATDSGTFSTNQNSNPLLTTATIQGLINSTVYFFQIASVNSAGQGTFSNAVMEVPIAPNQAPPQLPPTAPQNFSITPGVESISVNWEPPLSTNGLPITSYTIEYAVNQSALNTSPIIETITNTTLRTFTLTNGITNGITYHVQIFATTTDQSNTEYEGAIAGPLTATPRAVIDTTAPTAPTNLRDVARSDTTITLQWDASTDDSGTILTYRVERASADDITGTFTTIQTTQQTRFTDGLTGLGLRPDTEYIYQVIAIDPSQNESPPSTQLTASTLATADTTQPSAPTNVQSTTQTDTTITLTWTPATDPESGISSYTIYQAGARVGTSNSTAFTHIDLTSSTFYSYTVSATNGQNLEGPQSSPALRITTAELNGGTPLAAPTNITVSNGFEHIILTWNAVPGATGYIVDYSDDFTFATGVQTRNTSTNTITITNLTNLTTYYFIIQTIGGQESRIVQGTPSPVGPQLPGQPAGNTPPLVTFASGPGGGSGVRASTGSSRSGGTRILQLLRDGTVIAEDGTIIEEAPKETLYNCLPDLQHLKKSQQRAACFFYGISIHGEPVFDRNGFPIIAANGQELRNFNGKKFLNRAEISKILSTTKYNFQTNEITNRQNKIDADFNRVYPFNHLPRNKNAKTGKFLDVAQGEWFAKYILYLFNKKIVSGVNNGAIFNPDGKLLRVELEKMVLNYVAYVLLEDDPNNIIATYLKNFRINGEWWLKYAAFSAEFLPNTEVGSKLAPGQRVDRAQAMEYFVAVVELILQEYQNQELVATN